MIFIFHLRLQNLKHLVISNIDGGTIRLNGKVRDWHINDPKRLWPENILPPVRSWYVSSIKDGKITDGDVVLILLIIKFKKQLTNESVFAKLNVSGVKLNYLSSFPNLNEASGFIEITPKKYWYT